jgi:hypothetical protein
MSDLSEEECPSFLSPLGKRQRSPDKDCNDEDAVVAQGGEPEAITRTAVRGAASTARSAADAAAVPTAGSPAVAAGESAAGSAALAAAASTARSATTAASEFTWGQAMTEVEQTAVEKALVKVRRAKEVAKAKRGAKKPGSGFRDDAGGKPASEKAAPRKDKGTFAGHRPPKDPEKLRFTGLQKDPKRGAGV